MKRFALHRGDAADAYEEWPQPDCLIVDGPYGVGGFFGDPRTPDSLADWYRPHIEAWTGRSKPSSTLWFWGTEIGWATVHPVLAGFGWEYVQAIHWDKGVGHIAGNVNSKTIRRFPIVNEIVVFYARRPEFPTPDGAVPARKWLLDEWVRSGLPRQRANDACGVADAATRKYFDQGWLWYPPPAEPMQKLVDYANEHGDQAGRPYYSLDGTNPITGDEWAALRYRWKHTHGITNVWQHPALRNRERLKNRTGDRQAPRVHKPTVGVASAHLNQKPIEFMRRILRACTAEGDVVWEPFGGLCSASVAAIETGRIPFAAEIDERFAELAEERLLGTVPHPNQPDGMPDGGDGIASAADLTGPVSAPLAGLEGPADPLLRGLWSKLPTERPFSAADQSQWLRLAKLALRTVYGGGPAASAATDAARPPA